MTNSKKRSIYRPSGSKPLSRKRIYKVSTRKGKMSGGGFFSSLFGGENSAEKPASDGVDADMIETQPGNTTMPSETVAQPMKNEPNTDTNDQITPSDDADGKKTEVDEVESEGDDADGEDKLPNQLAAAAESTTTLGKLGNAVSEIGTNVQESIKNVMNDVSGENKSDAQSDADQESGAEVDAQPTDTSKLIALMQAQQEAFNVVLMDMSKKLDLVLDRVEMQPSPPVETGDAQQVDGIMKSNDEVLSEDVAAQSNDEVLSEVVEASPEIVEAPPDNQEIQPEIVATPPNNEVISMVETAQLGSDQAQQSEPKNLSNMGGKTMGRRNRRRKTKRKVVR
jgi:hypothetical protein